MTIVFQNRSLIRRIAAGMMLFGVLMLHFSSGMGQGLYHKWYGKPGAPCLAFLHGGPGYNSASFEIGAAERLAKAGFRVLVFDRRGAGRSEQTGGDFTYAEAVADLRRLLSEANVERVGLLGHSFGGVLALKYAEAYPGQVAQVVLVSAPLDFPATFKTIRRRCRAHYESRDDPAIGYMDILDTMQTGSLDYAVYCFAHAMQCGLYNVAEPTKQAEKVYRAMRKDERVKWLKKSTIPPVQGFYDTEAYTVGRHWGLLERVRGSCPVIGIYGTEDGLFGDGQLERLRGIVGEERFHLLEKCAHSVFLDRRKAFIALISKHCGGN